MARARVSEFYRTPDAMVARITGDRITFFTVDQIKRLVNSPAKMMFQMPVVLDLTCVEKIPRLVMQTLFKTLRELQAEGQRFIVTGLHNKARSADIIQFGFRFEIYREVNDALFALSRYSWHGSMRSDSDSLTIAVNPC